MSMPRLRSRSHWAWIWFTVLGIVCAGAWVAVTDPGNRLWALAATPVMLLFFYVGVAQRIVLHTEPAALVWRLPGLYVRRVPLEKGTAVQLRGAGSTVYVHARRGGQRVGVSLDVLALTEYTRRSRSIDQLDAVAQALQGSRAAGAAQVAHQLRQQVDHLRSGGDLEDSPLARDLGGTLLGLRY
jgi:hypothetical protein